MGFVWCCYYGHDTTEPVQWRRQEWMIPKKRGECVYLCAVHALCMCLYTVRFTLHGTLCLCRFVDEFCASFSHLPFRLNVRPARLPLRCWWWRRRRRQWEMMKSQTEVLATQAYNNTTTIINTATQKWYESRIHISYVILVDCSGSVLPSLFLVRTSCSFTVYVKWCLPNSGACWCVCVCVLLYAFRYVTMYECTYSWAQRWRRRTRRRRRQREEKKENSSI